ncbi:MAG: 50S ribosomal protein L19e [Candidatus Woesearchaeota archaeon]
MDVGKKKKIAAKVLKCSPKRVKFDPAGLEDIQEAITRGDIRNLVGSKIVVKEQKRNNSRSRARKTLEQKRKGRRKNPGSRKGKHGARVSSKQTWMIKVRLQRAFIKELKDKGHIDGPTYRNLYAKVKGGYFRNKRHIKLYLDEQK